MEAGKPLLLFHLGPLMLHATLVLMLLTHLSECVV